MDSVIVYRNPLEAMMWESIFNGGGWVFLAVAIAGGIGAFVYAQIDKHTSWSRTRYTGRGRARSFLGEHNGKISIAVAVLALYLMHLASIKGWL